MHQCCIIIKIVANLFTGWYYLHEKHRSSRTSVMNGGHQLTGYQKDILSQAHQGTETPPRQSMPAATSRTNPYQTQCLEPESLSRYHPVINWNTASFWHYDVSNMSFFLRWPLTRPIFRPIAAHIPEAFVCLRELDFSAPCGLVPLIQKFFFPRFLSYFIFDVTLSVAISNKNYNNN